MKELNIAKAASLRGKDSEEYGTDIQRTELPMAPTTQPTEDWNNVSICEYIHYTYICKSYNTVAYNTVTTK